MLSVDLAAPSRYRHLTVFPLVTSTDVHLPYALLVDSIEAGTLKVTEVGEGTVPSLLVRNRADTDVLILDGEQLIGARQNRMTNRSMILPAHGETEIPVSCMEQGRWHSVSDEFSPSAQHSPSSVRRRVREVESAHGAAGTESVQHMLAMAQGEVWASIAEQADALGAHVDTGALNEVARSREVDLGAALDHFPLQPLQVGLLAFVGGEAIGMDVVGGTNLYARLHTRLLRGYVLDALSARSPSGEATAEAAQRFLTRVHEAEQTPAASVGRGAYHVLSRTVVGSRLVDGDQVAHLCAFPPLDRRRGSAGEDAHPVAPPSRRRRR
jgi:hypothetical protein